VALRFALPHGGPVRVRIFDTAGRLVRQMEQTFAAGDREFVWDGADESGEPAPSGILFYEVTANGLRRTSRIVRMP
jgi:flagellar hook assembly protein FlgD